MSHWAQYEERVRLGCERFEQACRRNGFSGELHPLTIKEWGRGMRVWVRRFGEDWPLLDKAVDKMCAAELTIKSPESCITVAESMVQWGEKPKDYTHGALSEWVHTE
jgi:hypothetical protein